MSRVLRRFHKADTLAILFLLAWPFAYFFPVTLGQSVWFTTDILRLTYPFSLEFSRALDAGHMPLWTNGILAGFPLFAEGQVSVLYPLNFLFFRFLPAYYAISFSALLHLAFGACGMYVFARGQGMRAASACLAGFVFSFNGWVFGHLSHMGVIAAISWLPWSLYFLARFQKTRAGIWFLLIVIAVAGMYLSGSVQLAFLNSLAFLAIGTANAWFDRLASHLLRAMVPFTFGLGIAAVQLVPTAELVGYSVRSGTDAGFYTSYSLPVEFLQQFIAPFFQSEPSEGTGEYWAYFSHASLLLLFLAPVLKRDRRTIFYLLFAIIALSLALGGNNPLFSLLYRLPIFGLFRVPARYLYLFTFAAAICAAYTLDALAKRLDARVRFPRWSIVLAIPFLAAIYLAHTQSLEFWLTLWRVLPLVFAIFSVWLIALAFTRKIARENFEILMLGATVLDLALYMPPFLKTIDELSPAAAAATQPRSLSIFQSSQTPARVFTDLSVFPSVPAMRGSMYPNTALIYGVPSAQAYASLSFGRHEAYLSQASPAMLNLLNARWFAIPLEPRPSGDRATPPDDFYLALRDELTAISPTLSRAIEISSFTEQAEKLVDGTAVAEVELTVRDGSSQRFPVRVGIETADWDYERKNAIRHHMGKVAHSFPAFWRSFGRTFDGHTYLARFEFAAREVTALRLRALDPNAQFTIEQITLFDAAGHPKTLSTLANKNNFTLAYLSDTVAIWENQDALPRAFIAHDSEILNDSAAFARMQSPGFQPNQMVLLSEGNALQPRVGREPNERVEIIQYEPERVTVSAQSGSPGYLVLADSWYPGWNAYVDGKPAVLLRADVIFRAVPLEAGQHTVVFEYRPMSVIIGAMVSLISLALTLGIAFVLRQRRDSGV